MPVPGVGDVSQMFLHSGDTAEHIVVKDLILVKCVGTPSPRQAHCTTTRKHAVEGKDLA